jgi:hypothetical protein
MPQILIITDPDRSAGEVVYRERVLSHELESVHFSTQLVERLAWALGDATVIEHRDEREPAAPQRVAA